MLQRFIRFFTVAFAIFLIASKACSENYKQWDVFTAETIEGITIKFCVADVDKKECHVGANDGKVAVVGQVNGHITIPSEVNGFTVTRIGPSAFMGTGISSASIPGTITSIGGWAFRECKNLKSVDVPNSVTEIGAGTFKDCFVLEKVHLPELLKTIEYMMFDRCWELKSVNIPSSTTKIGSEAFYGCHKIESISIPASVMQIAKDAFSGCESLTKVYSYITEPFEQETLPSCASTLYVPEGTKEKYKQVPNWNKFDRILEFGEEEVVETEAYAVLSTDQKTLSFYYDDQRTNREGTIFIAANFRNGTDYLGDNGWYQYCDLITSVIFDKSFADYDGLTNTGFWFAYFGSLTSISGLEYLNTSNVTDMKGMFASCKSLTSLDVSHFNTSNVTDMSMMFMSCSNLKYLDVSGFDVSNVTDMTMMFSYCSALASLDVSKFDTKNVMKMTNMFSSCSYLSELDLSAFNTENVVSMEQMFAGCANLTSLSVTNFDTSNIIATGVQSMFYGCSSLKELDLSSFRTSNVYDMSFMFFNCISLTTIYVGSGWNVDNVTSSNNMFANCTSLIGGDGTVFDPNYTDKTKAYAGTGGYLTLKGGQGEDPDTGEGWHTLINKKLLKISAQADEWMMLQDNGYLVIHRSGSTHNILFDAYIDPDNPNYLRFYYEAIPYYRIIINGNRVKLYDENALVDEVPTASYTIDGDGADVYDHIGDNTFRAYTAEGVLMRFKVIDEVNMTCQPFAIYEVGTNGVGVFSSTAIPSTTAGIVTIPKTVNEYTVTQICERAFEGCSAIQSIVVPEEVDSIGSRAFAECTQMTSIDMPATITRWGVSVFQGCTSLTSFTMPYSFGQGGAYMFDGCTALDEVEFPEGMTYIPKDLFRNCSGLTTVSFPSTILTIDDGAFYKCSRLTSIELPLGISYIGKAAFYNCKGLATVTVGESVLVIEENAFGGCTNLTGFYIYAVDVPDTHKNAFIYASTANATLHVPVGSKELYAGTIPWNAFGKIVEIGDLDPIEEEIVVNISNLEGQDLSNNVVDNIYYNIGADGYDASDQSIVISQSTDMEQIADATPGSSDIVNNFVGLILMIEQGKGVIHVNTKTSGAAQLAVQVGSNNPTMISKSERSDIAIDYDATETTYVYIYAIIGSSAAPSMRASSADEVRIYGFTVNPGASGIKAIWTNEDSNAQIFSLDGKPLNEPQKGVNIVRMSNGQVRKVIVK